MTFVQLTMPNETREREREREWSRFQVCASHRRHFDDRRISLTMEAYGNLAIELFDRRDRYRVS